MISKRINNNRNLETEAEIRAIAIEKAKANKDGFFIQHRQMAIRTMSPTVAEQTLNAIGFDNTMMHFRFATVGVKAEHNIHGWENGDYQFMHNGGISDFNYHISNKIGYQTGVSIQTGSDQHSADSKILFDKLVDEIKKNDNSDKLVMQAIRNVVKGINFWGRGVLIDKVKDKAFLFGEDWYVFKFNEEYIVFSSHDINSTEREFQAKSHGVPFKEVRVPLAEATFDGIAIIQNFSKPYYRFKLRGELESKSYNFNGYTNLGAGNYGWSQDDLDADAYANAEKAESKKYSMYEDDDDENEGLEIPEYVYDDVMELVPEYQSMNPYEMETTTNETGTHDVYGICCQYGTCWIYEDPDFKAYLEEEKVLNGQIEML